MSLRTQAEADLSFILEDASAFGWPVTLTDPSGSSVSLTGSAKDVSEQIDPETGHVVSVRVASVTLRRSSITKAGLNQPQAITSRSAKPWTVTFDDINGSSHTFKVIEAKPDRTVGLVVLTLESYKQ